MHVLAAGASLRRARILAVVAGLAAAAAVLIASLAGPSSASAASCDPTVPPAGIANECPWQVTGTHSISVPLSTATQNATGVPGDPGASGTSNITLNADTNTVCATTSWTGIDSPVVMAHIHGGSYGQPENPAITISLFQPDMINGRSSPASGCTLVPPGQIGAIVRCKGLFNVVVHSQKHPVGAIRGQLGTGGCAIPA